MYIVDVPSGTGDKTMNQVTYKTNHLKDESCIRIFRGDYVKTYTGIYKVVGQRNFIGCSPLIEAMKLNSNLETSGDVVTLFNNRGECIAKSDLEGYVASGQHLTSYELPYNTVEDTE